MYIPGDKISFKLNGNIAHGTVEVGDHVCSDDFRKHYKRITGIAVTNIIVVRLTGVNKDDKFEVISINVPIEDVLERFYTAPDIQIAGY